MSKKHILLTILLVVISFGVYSCSNENRVSGTDANTNSDKHNTPSSLYSIPNDRYYSADDMWVKMLDDSTAFIGVTEKAISAVTPCNVITEDIPIRIKHPPKSKIFSLAGGTNNAGIFDAYSPLNGKFVTWNSNVFSNPSLISSDPYNNGWILKVTGIVEADLNALMSAVQYSNYIGQ